MQEKELSEVKKEIRSVLITYPKGVYLIEFRKTYKNLVGKAIPSSRFGFPTDLDFLKSISDVVTVNIASDGSVHLTGVADEKSQHIKNLVSRQRNTKPNNNKKSNTRQPVRRPTPSPLVTVREVAPFLPGPLRAEILQVMAMFPNSVTFPAFALAYRKKFKKCLPLLRGLDTLEGMIKLIPELEVRSENKERKICHVRSESNQKMFGSSKKASPSKYEDKAKTAFHIHESGIPDDVLQNFQLMLEKCPSGILDFHFPPLYENFTKTSFDLHEFGYSSMTELVDALPHIFKRVLNPEDNKNWLILPAEARIKHCSQDNSFGSKGGKQNLRKSGTIPPDAALPVLQYIPASIPENVDLTMYVPVFVSAIINPSLFWFQLHTDEAAKRLESFEMDMENFYNNFADQYKMNESDIVMGATCIIQCPDDGQWYRAKINSFPKVDLVNVSFVDYGSAENVPIANIYYVRSNYLDFPACAFKAQLAGVKPPHNEAEWSIEARSRFVQLCSNGILMANLKSIEKGTHLVYLCDTNGETDIHLSDTLMNEELAELASEVLDVSSSDSQNSFEEISISNGIKEDSGFDISSRSDQDALQSDKSDSVSESEILSAKQRLSFTPQKNQCNGIDSKISPHGHKPKSRRYLKLVQICEETKMHFINLENKLFMSCAEVAKLIWSDKDSNFLIERLHYKDVTLPFQELSKDHNLELFNQCILYKIPEFEALQSNKSLLTVCPVECVIDILNIFGHPSVCLRLTIQDEMRRFDPLDSFWKEFHYDESQELNDIEKEIDQKLRNLCLYDLRVKSEALKIRRFKLSLIKDGSADEEIKAVELQQKVIIRRMKQIEAICTQYGSC